MSKQIQSSSAAAAVEAANLEKFGPVRDREFLSVRLPASVPFFDCRWPEEVELPKCQKGFTLFGAERAIFFLMGGKRESYPFEFSGMCHTSFYFDSRNSDMKQEAARIVQGLRDDLARAWRQYRKALRNPAKPGDGGSVYHKPAFIELSNYGAGVYGFYNDYAVQRFTVQGE